ncbi:MAG: T9SS type A sorting domain-containing protein [Bacteroidales bacterium]|nr:T9SS type A sorting domain-containing protein [Bacteroidales bacterium]
MKRYICFLLMALIGVTAVFAQTVTLTFTAQDADNQYVQLNRVIITNLTRSWQETIYWPDTVLTMQNGVGIDNYIEKEGFALSQNIPNPFDGTTDVNLTVPEKGGVHVDIMDVHGKIVAAKDIASPHPGVHQFRISLSVAGTYVMTARQNGHAVSLKMLNCGDGGVNAISISDNTTTQYLTTTIHPQNTPKGSTNHPFSPGDHLEYVGYATVNGSEMASVHVNQTQYTSENIVLRFAEGHPCPGTPTVTDFDGNVYNTVQIGQQCWMKENIRTTHYFNGTSIPNGEGIPPESSSLNSPLYFDYWSSGIALSQRGYLYNFSAATGNEIPSNPQIGVQGICPNGWHVPSDAEWTQLTDYVRSQNQYVCGGNTANVAKALASETEWNYANEVCCPGNQSQYANNTTGFSVIPAGGCNGSLFVPAGTYARFWTSTDSSYPGDSYYRAFSNDYAEVDRHTWPRQYGMSVRCIRN